ncbi:MAG TPA: hypothetical protein P5277_00365 [Candidatus Paceibacterota bacterium]|nr:hypothetical protein [Candidatus Paceibacterota bacterium]
MSKKSVKAAEKREKDKKQNLHHALIKILLKSPVTNVKFYNNKISLDFFNHKIADRITIKKQPHIAEWSRKENERKIIIDKYFKEKAKKKSFKALCIHEAIERFLVKKYGLNTDKEAHVVATQKEKEYLESIKGNWRSHEMEVFWDWHKLGEQ